jgi:lycopene cyclase domain-containing protein
MNEPEMNIREKDKKAEYRRGKKYPAFVLAAAPFIAFTVWLAKRVKGVSVQSLITLILLFEITVLFIEHNAVMKGHWVYNLNKIIGPLIWEVPIEEPLIYYLWPPIMVVVIFHWFVGVFEKKRN